MTPATTPAGRDSQLQTALIGLAFLIGAAVFVVSSGSWFDTFQTVHVMFVVIWVGGGAALTILGIVAETKSDGVQLAAIARQAAFLGQRVFAPSAIVVVVMGAAMVENAHIGYGHFWVVFGLLGFLTTFVLGVAVLTPMSAKVSAIITEQGPETPEAKAAIARILLIARADVAMLLLVIVDMVAKPFS
ncbi:MAG TPA: DUF2269 family protein [Gaiellaceae bacterium]|nr:DUF2269 family protein [Gaiellaceae bacterium]